MRKRSNDNLRQSQSVSNGTKGNTIVTDILQVIDMEKTISQTGLCAMDKAVCNANLNLYIRLRTLMNIRNSINDINNNPRYDQSNRVFILKEKI